MTYLCMCWAENTPLPPQLEWRSQSSPFVLYLCDYWIYVFCDTYKHLASSINAPMKMKKDLFTKRQPEDRSHQGNDRLMSKDQHYNWYWTLLYHDATYKHSQKNGVCPGHTAWCNETGWQARASGILFCCLHRFASSCHFIFQCTTFSVCNTVIKQDLSSSLMAVRARQCLHASWKTHTVTVYDKR